MKIPYDRNQVEKAFEELMSAGAPEGEKKRRLDEFRATLAFLQSDALIHEKVAEINGVSPDALVVSPSYKKFIDSFYSNLFAEKTQELEGILGCTNVQAWAFLLAYTGLLGDNV